jgi:CheY-like chemotaxis protein
MSTILIAEDRDASRELIRAVLTAGGYDVVEARDGREALECAVRLRADLVILDIHMPHLDGFEVLERLRALDHYARVPVIALTASAMAGDRERAIASGFSEFISKPVNLALLRREVERLLGRGASAAGRSESDTRKS